MQNIRCHNIKGHCQVELASSDRASVVFAQKAYAMKSSTFPLLHRRMGWSSDYVH